MVYHYMYHLKFIKEKFMVCVARGSCGSTVECVTPRLTHTHVMYSLYWALTGLG